MILKDTLGLHGRLKIFAREKGETEWKLVVEKNNLIVNVGRTMMRDKLTGEDTTSYLQSFAFGTGTTPPTVNDTGLESPVSYDGTNTYKAFEEFTEDDYKTITFVGFLSSLQPSSQPVDLTEVALCTGVLTTQGIMYCRATFDAITKTTTMELRLEYTQEI